MSDKRRETAQHIAMAVQALRRANQAAHDATSDPLDVHGSADDVLREIVGETAAFAERLGVRGRQLLERLGDE